MNTVIENGSERYVVKSLQELADFFFTQSEKESDMSQKAATKVGMSKHAAAANAFYEASEIIRKTTLPQQDGIAPGDRALIVEALKRDAKNSRALADTFFQTAPEGLMKSAQTIEALVAKIGQGVA